MKESLHRSVIVLSFVSLFTDISSEMIYPLLPIYLVSVIGSTPAVLGFIEGCAEAVASLFKYLSGAWSDEFSNKKNFIVFGYSISSFFRPLIGIANSWPLIFLIRFIDRMGKGIRSPARDAVLAEVTDPQHQGRAFGFNRAMDHTGAVLGPLIASALLAIPGMTYNNVFLLAFIPGAISVFLVVFKLEKSAITHEKNIELSKIDYKILSNPIRDFKYFSENFKSLLFSIFIFGLGNSTDAFLLLKLKFAGVPDSFIPASWSIFHIVKASSSHFLGPISDRIGHKKMLEGGWIIFALVYLGMAFLNSKELIFILFISYGIFFGMTEAPTKALISKMSPTNLKGSAFGLYHMVIGFSTLPASIIFGLLWTLYSPQIAFLFGSSLALIAWLRLLKTNIQK